MLSVVPAGSVAIIGHPANGLTATKQNDGRWTANVEPHRAVDPEDVARMGFLIYPPSQASEVTA